MVNNIHVSLKKEGDWMGWNMGITAKFQKLILTLV